MDEILEGILEGDSVGIEPSDKLFIFELGKKTIHEIGAIDDYSEQLFQKRSRKITKSLSQKFGGDWVCIVGKQSSETNFGYYIPSIRNISFLVDEKHFIFVAQIFQERVPFRNT
ncbi:developmentally-regulated protein [Acrasis kona]|uniref:Developmentally-regulated protein n=1 Tax=Acrasis kona TaxID=1008807 RepID=A0AAW2YNU6_9EUKA